MTRKKLCLLQSPLHQHTSSVFSRCLRLLHHDVTLWRLWRELRQPRAKWFQEFTFRHRILEACVYINCNVWADVGTGLCSVTGADTDAGTDAGTGTGAGAGTNAGTGIGAGAYSGASCYWRQEQFLPKAGRVVWLRAADRSDGAYDALFRYGNFCIGIMPRGNELFRRVWIIIDFFLRR